MNRYYQVFLSSVSNEFNNIRKSIIESLMESKFFFPVAMEYMNGIQKTIPLLYDYMSKSDICLLLFGNEKGTIIGKNEDLSRLCSENEELYTLLAKFENNGFFNITYTELEYYLAKYFLKDQIKVFITKESENLCNKGNHPRQSFYDSFRDEITYDVFKDEEELLRKISNWLTSTAMQLNNKPLVGWIREAESKIYQSTESAGIRNVKTNGFIDSDELRQHLNNTKVLKVFFTTGLRFFEIHKSILTEFVNNGGKIQFLCCKPFSVALEEVKRSEEQYGGFLNREEIHKEYSSILNKLKEINNNAMINKTNQGSICVRFCDTLFRSSIILCENEIEDKYNFGWLTITLPPAKAQDSILLEISPSKNNENKSLFFRAREHFRSVWELHKATEIKIDNKSDNTALHKSIFIPYEDTIYWKQKEIAATINMRNHNKYKKILIEVAAQHPLLSNGKPNDEFKARLDLAYDLYNKFVSKKISVEIYVPGSKHLNDKIPDVCSLSESGCKYLKAKGIPSEILHGEELNDYYNTNRSYSGVYNSADECFISANYFNDSRNRFKKLICVCSQNQLMRKTLFYIEFGIVPEIYTTPVQLSSHNFFIELFEKVPFVVSIDHDWQKEKSEAAINSRINRDPNWKGN